MLLTCVESSPQSGGPCDLRETVTIPSRRRDMCGYSRLLDLMCACRFIETQSLPPSAAEKILNEQRLRRPNSPHFTIYQPQLTWLSSIANRVTGAGLSTCMSLA